MDVCLSTDLNERLHRSLVRDTMDQVVLNRTTDDELLISVKTCDRCGRMSQQSVNRTVMVQGKSVLSTVLDNVTCSEETDHLVRF